MWKCERRSSLAREFSCALLCSSETESFLAGYPPETNEKKMAMLTVLGYKCPSFSFPVEIAPCCYTLDIGNKRDHLNVHVSVTEYIKKHVIKINGEIKHKKVKFYATFLISHLLQKNWVATVMQKFIISFLCLAYNTTLRPPPPPPPLLPGFWIINDFSQWPREKCQIYKTNDFSNDLAKTVKYTKFWSLCYDCK